MHIPVYRDVAIISNTNIEFPIPPNIIPQHFTSGFRRTLSTFTGCNSYQPANKDSPATEPESEPQPQPDEPSVSQANPSAPQGDQDVAVELVGTCTGGSSMTDSPMFDGLYLPTFAEEQGE